MIYYLKNKLAASYSFVSPVSILCPNCRNVISFPPKRNLLQRLVSISLTMLQRILNLVLNRKPEPDLAFGVIRRDKLRPNRKEVTLIISVVRTF